MAYCAIAKTTSHGEMAETLEAEYMAVVKSYREKEMDIIRDTMPRLLALTTEGVFDRCDFLGEIYHELELHNKELGQFFTPYSLCYMMAKMTIAEQVADIKSGKKKFFTLDEPAAGGGAMILAVADALQDEGLNPSFSMYFRATDLSPMAFRMVYIQTSLRALSGEVFHGNTLSLETFRSHRTPIALQFYGLRGDPFKKPDIVVRDRQNPRNSPVLRDRKNPRK